MTASTVILNVGTGGAATLFDTLTTVDGAAAPASAVAQMVKVGHGAASDFKTASATNPLPVVLNAETTKVIGTVNISAAQAVTANAGTNLNTSALALDATLTGGTQKAIARSGAKGTAVAADITSNPVDANTQALHVNLAGTNAVNATLTAETTKVIGTVNVAAAQTIAVTQATPANLQATVTPIAITKGTQGATGFTTQDLKDAGRVMVNYTVSALAGVTAEALVSLTPYRDLTAGAAATTHAVTATKRLRLQSMTVTARSTSTVNVGALVRFRMLAGTVLVGSPVHLSVGTMSSNLATAVAGNAQTAQINFPDGFELSGTMQFGLTQLCSAITVTLDIHVTGYEY